MAPLDGPLDVTLESRIRTIRGQRVMLDRDLAVLYGVSTAALNQAVTRNIERFPPEFMFRLSGAEFRVLKSQSVTSKVRGGTRRPPLAFTEHGVAMLSSVLRSERAIAVNVEIIRAFIRFRQLRRDHADLAKRIDELEAKYDATFRSVFDAIRALMRPTPAPARPIGFRPDRNATKARSTN